MIEDDMSKFLLVLASIVAFTVCFCIWHTNATEKEISTEAIKAGLIQKESSVGYYRLYWTKPEGLK